MIGRDTSRHIDTGQREELGGLSDHPCMSAAHDYDF